jgi:hypothetical protein
MAIFNAKSGLSLTGFNPAGYHNSSAAVFQPVPGSIDMGGFPRLRIVFALAKRCIHNPVPCMISIGFG